MLIKSIRTNPLSVLAMLVVALLMLNQAYRTGSWRNNRSIIHDITSYYSYLPAALIYNDFQFEYRYELPENEPFDHLWVNTRGDTVFQKMSIGLSYFYLPTFIPAHWYTKNYTDFNANGFSKPYQMALNINTLLFGFLGLLMCWLIAKRFFADWISALIILLMYAGTNLLYYTSVAPGLSHPYSFFLIALMLLLSLYYFDKPSRILLFLLAFTLGLIVLVRPTNLILCLYPVLYGIGKHKDVLMNTLAKPINYLLVMLAFFLPWIPQFIYWDYAVGQWFFYSYDQESFFFNRPHIIDGLFSYRKGWLLYTPIMVFALIGLFLNNQFKSLTRPLLIILPIFMFVVFSWWCWWYGGSFGSRVMIDAYPLLIVGLGSFILWLSKQRFYLKIPAVATLLFCVVLNLNQIWQYSLGMLHWDSMSKKAYWSIFLKDRPPSNFQELLQQPDYEQAKLGGEEL